jgi:hypothetical protein
MHPRLPPCPCINSCPIPCKCRPRAHPYAAEECLSFHNATEATFLHETGAELWKKLLSNKLTARAFRFRKDKYHLCRSPWTSRSHKADPLGMGSTLVHFEIVAIEILVTSPYD